MSSLVHLGSIAIRHTAKALGLAGGELLADGAQALVRRFFSADSKRLETALRNAHERAFEALEFALARDTLWQKLTAVFARADDKEFRAAVRAALDALPADLLPEGPVAFREDCRRELGRARRDNRRLLEFDADALEAGVGALARFSDPAALAEAEFSAVAALRESLPAAEYPALRKFLTLRAAGGPPILLIAVRYFFLREVEADPELSRGQIHEAVTAQGEWLRGVDALLRTHADRTQHLLNDVLDVAQQTLDEVKSVREELGSVRGLLNLVADAVLRPSDRTSVRSEDQRRRVAAAVEKFLALPLAAQSLDVEMQLEAGRMLAVLGDLDAARRHFEAAAKNAADRHARAKAEYNAYRAALEQQQSDDALAALRRAVELDRAFEPFPFSVYEPLAILGAGGFGTTFKCRHRRIGHVVAVKSLSTSDLDRDIDAVFGEAGTLKALRHPGIIGVEHADWCQQSPPERPYLCLEYFDGVNLDEYIRRNGPFAGGHGPDGRIPPERLSAFLDFAIALGEALRAAHGRGVLHRDLKPRNVMVREEGGGLIVKLIDFGLALRLRNQTELTAAMASGNSLIGSSAVGSFYFAAPEQMGDPEMGGVSIGAYSDVYGFAKTCCFALFGTHQPEDEDWESVSEPLRKTLQACLRRSVHGIGGRPRRTGTVGDVLNELRGESDRVGRAHKVNVAAVSHQSGGTTGPAETPRVVAPAAPNGVMPQSPPSAPMVTPTEPPEDGADNEYDDDDADDDEAPIVIVGPPELPRPRVPRAILGAGVLAFLVVLGLVAYFTANPRYPVHPAPSPGVAEKTLTLDLGGGVKLDLVRIEAGEFEMGSPVGEEGRGRDEGPQHRVRISKPFYMGKYEVTQAQWRAVMGDNPSYFKGDDLPVEQVSWEDAQRFCEKLSQRSGRSIRLPTEAEWEYACRAGTETPFHFGATLSTQQANYDGNYMYGEGSKGEYREKTTPVGGFPANGWGLHDAHGNVREWCADWYDTSHYEDQPDPDVDPSGPGSGADRVLRGGSWYNGPGYCRSAFRYRDSPDLRYRLIGFRVASGTK